MVQSQVINPSKDKVMIFDGFYVINNSTQLELGRELAVTEIQVDLNLWDLMTNSNLSVENITMTYRPTVDCWTINVDDVKTILVDTHKFVGYVSEHSPIPNNMRSFKVLEFTIYYDDLENTLFSLPYEIVITGGSANFQWYDNLIDKNILYSAEAYEGGVNTTPATHPSRVTHRGPVTRNAM
jgi:hypothetical protein